MASQERKIFNSSDSKVGNKPDAILAAYYNNIKYELMYVENSRIICSSRKKDDDYLKLCRQCNDGILWVFNSCSPAKNQFCLLGLQIFG